MPLPRLPRSLWPVAAGAGFISAAFIAPGYAWSQDRLSDLKGVRFDQRNAGSAMAAAAGMFLLAAPIFVVGNRAAKTLGIRLIDEELQRRLAIRPVSKWTDAEVVQVFGNWWRLQGALLVLWGALVGPGIPALESLALPAPADPYGDRLRRQREARDVLMQHQRRAWGGDFAATDGLQPRPQHHHAAGTAGQAAADSVWDDDEREQLPDR